MSSAANKPYHKAPTHRYRRSVSAIEWFNTIENVRIWPEATDLCRPLPTWCYLYLRSLRDVQRVFKLDTTIPHGTLPLRMTEEQLDGPKILGSPVDQRGFGAPQ